MHFGSLINKAGTETAQAIQKRKVFFVILILLQLIFFGALGSVTTTNLQQMLVGTQGVLNQVEQANLDPQKISDGQPFLEDITPLYQSYQLVQTYALRWLFSLAIIAVTLYAALWLGSHSFFEKYSSWKDVLQKQRKRWLYFVLLVIILGLSCFILFSVTVKASLFGDPDQERLYARLTMLGYLFLVVYYLFICAAAQIGASSLKKMFWQSFTTGIKKIRYSLPLAVILFLFIMGAGYLVKLVMELSTSFALLVSSTIFSATVIVLTRLFWIKAQQQIILLTEKNG